MTRFGSVIPWERVAASSPVFLPAADGARDRRHFGHLRRRCQPAVSPFAGLLPRLPRFLSTEKRFPRITNCVVKVCFNHKIYQPWVTLHVPYAEYMPNKLPAIKIRLSNGFSNTTCLIFHSGYMILTGARTFYTAYRDAFLYYTLFMEMPQPALVHRTSSAGSRAPLLLPGELASNPAEWGARLADRTDVYLAARPLGPRLRIRYAAIVNTVSTGVLCAHSLALDQIKHTYPESTSYDPNAFAGLYFTLTEKQCPALRDLLPLPGGDILFGNRIVPPRDGRAPATPSPDPELQLRSRKASLFDSGSCSIIGMSTREANGVIYRYFADMVDQFDDPARPRNRSEIHAYRLHHFVYQRPLARPRSTAHVLDHDRGPHRFLPAAAAAGNAHAREQESDGDDMGEEDDHSSEGDSFDAGVDMAELLAQTEGIII